MWTHRRAAVRHSSESRTPQWTFGVEPNTLGLKATNQLGSGMTYSRPTNPMTQASERRLARYARSTETKVEPDSESHTAPRERAVGDRSRFCVRRFDFRPDDRSENEQNDQESEQRCKRSIDAESGVEHTGKGANEVARGAAQRFRAGRSRDVARRVRAARIRFGAQLRATPRGRNGRSGRRRPRPAGARSRGRARLRRSLCECSTPYANI